MIAERQNGGGLTLINQDQTEVISGRVFLVDLPEGRSKVKSTQEKPNGYRLASRRGPIHDLKALAEAGAASWCAYLKSDQRLTLIVLVWSHASCLSTND